MTGFNHSGNKTCHQPSGFFHVYPEKQAPAQAPSLLENVGEETFIACVLMTSPTHKNMTRISHMVERRLCTH